MPAPTRRVVALLGLALLAAPVAAQQPAPVPPPIPPAAVAQPARPTGVAATVNGQPIPEVAVWRALRQFPAEEHPVARKEILNHLVENVLIDQYLTALKIEVAPAETDKLLDELKAELKKGNKDYAKELEAMMLTEAEFRTEVTAQMKWDKFLKQQGTDQALKAFYDKRPDLFDGSLVRARHILLTPGTDPVKIAEAKKKLMDIKATVAAEGEQVKAATPGDALAKEQARNKKVEELFATYAKDNSACPTKANGGDLMFFPRVGAMVEAFADAAFKLPLYQMSDVVETEFGQHLILVTGKQPGKPRKFEDVKEEVRAVYAMQLRQAVVAQRKPASQIVITPK